LIATVPAAFATGCFGRRSSLVDGSDGLAIAKIIDDRPRRTARA